MLMPAQECSLEVHETRGSAGVRAAQALVAEARARLLPLALCAPKLALLHAVDLPALFVVGARPPARAARRPARCRKPHVFLEQTKF